MIDEAFLFSEIFVYCRIELNKQNNLIKVPLQPSLAVSRITFATFFSVLSLSCAGQAPPQGGPIDTESPTIIFTYPDPNTTGYQENRFLLEFSEYVDRRSVEESIFISPAVGSLEFDWSGREVEVRFNEPLRKNITYVVSVGTDVIDVRNKNRMAESFTIAFSPGTTIDSASLSGKIFHPKPQGVTIFAYMLNNRLQDTLNPAAVKPDYVTQTGNDGSFRLNHLAWGRYRLFALRDEFKNFLYNPQVDQIGMATRDFDVNQSNRAINGIQFQLTKEDTSRPFVLDAQTMNKNLVLVRFSEAMDKSTLNVGAFSVMDTFLSSQFSVEETFSAGSSLNAFYVLTVDQDSTHSYRVTVDAARDTAGNLVNESANSAVFQGSSLPDTVLPKILSLGVQDSARNIPYSASFDFVFSEGIKKTSFEKGFHLHDSSGHEVEGEFQWSNAAAVQFTPRESLLPFAWYRIQVQLDSLKDFANNCVHDSLFFRRFQTVDSRKLGSIRGKIEDPEEGDKSPLYLLAVSISDKTAVPIVLRLETVGDFTFENLTEGKYVVQAYRDADNNGKYTFGKSFPFAYSERFVVYSDTIKVRARWPVEGVTLRF